MIATDRRCVYRYYFLPEIEKEDETPVEEPLIYCPKCQEDLTKPNSIKVTIDNHSSVVEFKSRLDFGVLQDTKELAILNHGKEEVTCAHCGVSLADLDEVYEEELII